MRTTFTSLITEAVHQYDCLKEFDPDEWLSNPKNIALLNGEDVALFEYFREGVYFGHYFLFSRGRGAIDSAETLLREAFTEQPIRVIVGLTPLTNKKAKWMNRKLGFKFQGILKDEDPSEIVILTKEEWLDRIGEQ